MGVTWNSLYGKWYGVSIKKLKSELPFDPSIPVLSIYLDKTLIQKDTHIPMFITVLFTLAKTWKQPKCPLADEQCLALSNHQSSFVIAFVLATMYLAGPADQVINDLSIHVFSARLNLAYLLQMITVVFDFTDRKQMDH